MFVGPLHHADIMTSNMDKAIAFWTDILGWRILSDLEHTGPYVSTVYGLPTGAKVRGVMLYPPGDIYYGGLELVEFTPSGRPLPQDDKPNDLGVRIICFKVRDIEKTYEELKKKGCKFISPPGLAKGKGWALKVCVFSDPVDNCKIELVEFTEVPKDFKK